MSDYILRASNICKSFSGVRALKNVSIEIKKGEIHCLAGENGCGKSTLINIISGVYTMDSGTVELHGKPYKKITPVEAITAGVQVIFQDFAVFPNLTVKENISLSSMISSKDKIVKWSKIKDIAQKAINLIDVSIDLNKEVKDISVADKQLVAICRALINDAKLLIMDEPTTALTKKEVKSLFNTVLQLRDQGLSILFVSHKLDEVFEICDRYTILRNGENVISDDTKSLDNDSFAYYMTGRKFENEPYRVKIKDQHPLLEVRDLQLEKAFSNVSFTLYPGEIIGLAGLLGSGRNEVALSLFGLQTPDAGEIYIHGEKKKFRSVTDAINCGIGYVPEDRLTEGVFMERSIGDNIIVSKLGRLANKIGVLNKKQMQTDIDRITEQLKIKTDNQDNAVQTLSGGNQQRVVLGKWIARDMEILILNGPTVGVDIGSKYDIHQLLKDLAEEGRSVIIISDDLPELLSLTNRIFVMNKGTIETELLTEQISEQELAGYIGA